MTDSSQAAAPGAAVIVLNVETQASRKTISNEQGFFTLPLLPPGPYQVTVQREGFRTAKSGLRLIVDQVATLDFVLEVGAIAESVEVSAQAAALDAQTSSLGQLILNTRIQNIPLNGRSAFRLVQLTPAVLAARAARKATKSRSTAAC